MRASRLMRSWYGALSVLATVALVGQVVLVLSHHRSLANFFSYFTVQSNILVLAMSVVLVSGRALDGDALRVLQLAALTGITVTGVVYGTVIAPYVNPVGAERVYDTIFHYVVPAMAVLGFLVCRPRTPLQRRDLVFIAWPLAWIAYTLVRGGVSHPGYPRADGTRSSYPYGFLDVDLHGWGAVLGAIVGVAVVLVALASVYVWAGADRDARTTAGRASL
jgi:hypothetical protein